MILCVFDLRCFKLNLQAYIFYGSMVPLDINPPLTTHRIRKMKVGGTSSCEPSESVARGTCG